MEDLVLSKGERKWSVKTRDHGKNFQNINQTHLFTDNCLLITAHCLLIIDNC